MTRRALVAFWWAGWACLVATGCAQAPVHSPSHPAVPIDLRPRCTEELLGERTPSEAIRIAARKQSIDRGESGAIWIAESSPSGTLARIQWGFPLDGKADERTLSLATTLMASGELTAEPTRWRRAVRAIGGRVEIDATEDWIWLDMKSPESELRRAWRLMEALLSPEPAGPAGVAEARRRTGLLRLADSADPTAQAGRLFSALHPVEGRAETKPDDAPAEMTPERVARAVSRILDPTRSVVIFQGLDPEFAKVLWTSTFDDGHGVRSRREGSADRDASPAAERGREGVGGAPSSPQADTIELIDRPASPHVELLVGYPTVDRSHPDAPALEMWASLLGGNVGGRLFRDLRERHGLAYIINAEQQAEGRLVVTTRARPERVVALLKGIESHLGALLAVPLLACEREMLVTRMRGELALENDDPDARADRLRTEVEVFGAPQSISERLAGVDEAAARRLAPVATRYFDGPPTMIVVGDADGLSRDLERAFPNRRVRRWKASQLPREAR